MAQISWNSTGARHFESGIDRGVLYPPEGKAVPWNGLIALEEASDTQIEPLYFDGLKYHDHISRGDYKATLHAYTYPKEFDIFDGVAQSPVNGITVTGQIPIDTFDLSYRTMIGNDIEGINRGYKIHVLYNLTAVPSNRVYQTMSPQISAYEFSWELSSVPVPAFEMRPTSHLIFDTTKMHDSSIYEIERCLYGTETLDGMTVPPADFEAIAAAAPDLVVNGPASDGSWSITGSEYYITKDWDSGFFEVRQANATYLDANTYDISSSDAEAP